MPVAVPAVRINGIDGPWPAEQDPADDPRKSKENDQEQLSQRDQERDPDKDQEQNHHDEKDEHRDPLRDVWCTARVRNVRRVRRPSTHLPSPVDESSPDRLRAEVPRRPSPPHVPHTRRRVDLHSNIIVCASAYGPSAPPVTIARDAPVGPVEAACSLCFAARVRYGRVTGDDVRRAKFRERLRGYDPAAVDAALDVLASRLDAGELRSSDLDGLHFPLRFRGYHQNDVDQLLQQFRAET